MIGGRVLWQVKLQDSVFPFARSPRQSRRNRPSYRPLSFHSLRNALAKGPSIPPPRHRSH